MKISLQNTLQLIRTSIYLPLSVRFLLIACIMQLKLYTRLNSSGSAAAAVWHAACGSCRFPQAGTQHFLPLASMPDQWNNRTMALRHYLLRGVFTNVCFLRRYDSVTGCNTPLCPTPRAPSSPARVRQRSVSETPSWRADFSGARFRTCIYMPNADSSF